MASIQPRKSPLKFARIAKKLSGNTTARNAGPRQLQAPEEQGAAADLGRQAGQRLHGVEAAGRGRRPRGGGGGRGARQPLAKCCKFLAGSFSAVSKRNFARKYVFDSIFQALQDLHTFAPLRTQKFHKKSV